MSEELEQYGSSSTRYQQGRTFKKYLGAAETKRYFYKIFKDQ